MNGHQIYQIRTGKEKSPKRRPAHLADRGTIFGICLLIAVLGAVWGDGKYSDAVLGTWVLAWTLIGCTSCSR
jgi:hypothetical protein